MSYWMAVRRRLAAIALSGIDVAALLINYTGNMTDEIVTMGDGNQYRLLTLTSSGTLNVQKEVIADIWLCGGGAGGIAGNSNYPGAGGGGGYVNSAAGQKVKSVVAVVGAAAGASSFGSITANGGSGKNGGSGGGGSYYVYGGTGAGVTTYPFGDTTYFNGKPHCAGGGGGGQCDFDTAREAAGKDAYACADGCAGGSNGASKSTEYVTQRYYWPGWSYAKGGSGGLYGGGKGCNCQYEGAGGSASFYGGGGGGGMQRTEDDSLDSTTSGGAGYQGVIYVRIPLNQAA